jgi:hypothetical protein
MECMQEARIARNEAIIDTHSNMLPELTAGLTRIATDLKSIKWCAIGTAVGYALHQVGFIDLVKALV